MTFTIGTPPKSARTPTNLQRFAEALAAAPCPPKEPWALVRLLDRRCGTYLDFELYRYDLDLALHRRQARDAVAAMQSVLAKLSGDGERTEPPTAHRRRSHTIFMPQDLVLEQLVRLDITDPDAREKRAEDLMHALHTVAHFPLRDTLAEDEGRPLENGRGMDVTRAVRTYLLHHEDQDFYTEKVCETGRRNLRRNLAAIAMVKLVFATLGINPRPKVETMVERVYAAEPGPAVGLRRSR